MEFEAGKRELVYERVDPDNAKQIEDASFCEREGFGTGLDPQELPPVLQFVARRGHIWLQYAVENGERIPTGVMELIPLSKALEYRPEDIEAGEYVFRAVGATVLFDGYVNVLGEKGALKETGNVILENHLKGCVADAISEGKKDEAIAEIMQVFKKNT